MNILVTGGTGFIGSHIAAALQRAGHRVRLLIRSKKKLDRVFGILETPIDDFVIGDVTDVSAVSRGLEDCEAVVHTAGMVSTARKDIPRVFETNVTGTRNVIDQALALGLHHIIHLSSITAVYQPEASRLDETSPPGIAGNAYGQSKVKCEHYVRALQAQGAPITITYPTSVIGPHDPGLTEPLQGLVFFLRAGALITKTGMQIIDVRDVADVHCQILDRPPKSDRFMIGGHYFGWPQLAETLEHLTGRRLRRLYVPPYVLSGIGKIIDGLKRLHDMELPADHEATVYASRWVVADSSKLERELSFRFRDPELSLADTLVWLVCAGHLKNHHIGRLYTAVSGERYARRNS